MLRVLDKIYTYIVRGHRVADTNKSETVRITSETMQIDPLVIAPIVAVPILIIILVMVLAADTLKSNSKKRAEFINGLFDKDTKEGGE